MQAVAAWSVLALVFILLISLGLPPISRPLVSLTDTPWQLITPDGPRQVTLPATLGDMGVEGGAVLERTLSIPDIEPGDPWMVWFERPRYGLTVWLDGQLVREAEDSDSPVAAVLPSVGGQHVLRVEVHGDLGGGGIFRRVLAGPQSALERLASSERARLLGLMAGLALLAVVHLASTSGRSWRSGHFTFSLLCAAAATAAFAESYVAFELFGGIEGSIRIRLAAYSVVVGLMIAFLSSFGHGEVRRREQIAGLVCTLLGVVMFAVPAAGLTMARHGQNLVFLVGAAWSAYLVLWSVRERVPGARVLLVTLIPVAVATGLTMAAAYGLWAGAPPYLLPTVVFLAGASAAVTMQQASDARRHRRLVTGSSDAMVCVDRRGRISAANPSTADLLGAQVGEVKQLLVFVHPEDRPMVRAHIEHSMARPDRAEFRMLTDRGEVVVESMATPLDKRTAMLVLRDVTRRKRVDEGLLQAARMETVGVLVGGIAHDFNNMLGTLMAHIGFLQVTLDTDPDVEHRLERMTGSIERAALLTRRLLTLARGTGSQLVAVELGKVCRSAAELVEPTLPLGVNLVVDLAEDDPMVLGAQSDLEHVIVNLLVNARDAVDGGGTIRMRTRPYKSKGAYGMVVVIEDTGPGVPDSVKSDIFAPFFSTKGPKRGSGLGLAVASQIARDHHGRIWVEDASGGGARFILALRHADTRHEAPAPMPEGRRVLLVEDEDDLRMAFQGSLTNAGYQVTACSEGAMAWRALQHDAPDILVTDVVMEGINGIELATMCRNLYPDVPVLLVSGFIPEASLGALNEGTWHRLDKPVRTAHLVATVGRLCRRAERAQRGELDITQVSYIMPPLEHLTGASIGL